MCARVLGAGGVVILRFLAKLGTTWCSGIPRAAWGPGKGPSCSQRRRSSRWAASLQESQALLSVVEQAPQPPPSSQSIWHRAAGPSALKDADSPQLALTPGCARLSQEGPRAALRWESDPRIMRCVSWMPGREWSAGRAVSLEPGGDGCQGWMFAASCSGFAGTWEVTKRKPKILLWEQLSPIPILVGVTKMRFSLHWHHFTVPYFKRYQSQLFKVLQREPGGRIRSPAWPISGRAVGGVSSLPANLVCGIASPTGEMTHTRQAMCPESGVPRRRTRPLPNWEARSPDRHPHPLQCPPLTTRWGIGVPL